MVFSCIGRTLYVLASLGETLINIFTNRLRCNYDRNDPSSTSTISLPQTRARIWDAFNLAYLEFPELVQSSLLPTTFALFRQSLGIQTLGPDGKLVPLALHEEIGLKRKMENGGVSSDVGGKRAAPENDETLDGKSERKRARKDSDYAFGSSCFRYLRYYSYSLQVNHAVKIPILQLQMERHPTRTQRSPPTMHWHLLVHHSHLGPPSPPPPKRRSDWILSKK